MWENGAEVTGGQPIWCVPSLGYGKHYEMRSLILGLWAIAYQTISTIPTILKCTVCPNPIHSMIFKLVFPWNVDLSLHFLLSWSHFLCRIRKISPPTGSHVPFHFCFKINSLFLIIQKTPVNILSCPPTKKYCIDININLYCFMCSTFIPFPGLSRD